jgi:hypothetical protein
MTREQRGAAEALRNIERWAKATFVAASIGAGALLAMTAGGTYLLLDYLAVKRGFAEASERLSKIEPPKFKMPAHLTGR